MNLTEQELHYNAPVKNCRTCVHCYIDDSPLWDKCSKLSGFCHTSITHCGYKFWQPKPKRRSLRRWLLDLIWT